MKFSSYYSNYSNYIGREAKLYQAIFQGGGFLNGHRATIRLLRLGHLGLKVLESHEARLKVRSTERSPLIGPISPSPQHAASTLTTR